MTRKFLTGLTVSATLLGSACVAAKTLDEHLAEVTGDTVVEEEVVEEQEPVVIVEVIRNGNVLHVLLMNSMFLQNFRNIHRLMTVMPWQQLWVTLNQNQTSIQTFVKEVLVFLMNDVIVEVMV